MNKLSQMIEEFAEKFAEEFAQDFIKKASRMFEGEPKVRKKRGPNKKKGLPDDGASDPTPPVKHTRHYRKNPETGGLEVKVDGQPAQPVGMGE